MKGLFYLFVCLVGLDFLFVFMVFLKTDFYWSIVLYDAVLVSTAQENESAIHIHVSSPFWTSFPWEARWNDLVFTLLSVWLELSQKPCHNLQRCSSLSSFRCSGGSSPVGRIVNFPWGLQGWLTFPSSPACSRVAFSVWLRKNSVHVAELESVVSWMVTPKRYVYLKLDNVTFFRNRMLCRCN